MNSKFYFKVIFASRLAESKRIVLLQIVSKPTDPDFRLSNYQQENKKPISDFKCNLKNLQQRYIIVKHQCPH